ncbi:MAG: hypothetical protein QG567_2148 [Campylobacterota bacterium]|nr:hypothetical protein [Campylobacterota bacterium]
MFKLASIFFILFFTAAAEDRCKIEDRVILSILKNESHPSKKIGYSYLISFNNSREAKHVKRYLPEMFLDSRTIDCQNKEKCITLANKLFSIGIKNLDLGSFQINSYWHKYDTKSYFDNAQSYKIACNYVEDMVAKHGYNWYAIARYHSKTTEYNLKYQKNLIKNYFANNEWGSVDLQ